VAAPEPAWVLDPRPLDVEELRLFDMLDEAEAMDDCGHPVVAQYWRAYVADTVARWLDP
jgi:hypothetical protein